MNCVLYRREWDGTFSLEIASTFDALWPLYEVHVPKGLRNGKAATYEHVRRAVSSTGSYSISDIHRHTFITIMKGYKT